jgi:hypothetical protein
MAHRCRFRGVSAIASIGRAGFRLRSVEGFRSQCQPARLDILAPAWLSLSTIE